MASDLQSSDSASNATASEQQRQSVPSQIDVAKIPVMIGGVERASLLAAAVNTVSGGVNVNGDEAHIGGDVTGRDKIVDQSTHGDTYNIHIERAENLAIGQGAQVISPQVSGSDEPHPMIDLEASVVAICSTHGDIVGTGFVVADDLIVTCAHVIGDRTARVKVKFLLSDQLRLTQVVTDYWRDSTAEDIAVLQLEGELPDGVQPVQLGPTDFIGGHLCRTIGFPKLDTIKYLYAGGPIIGRVTTLDDRVLLQISSSIITSGFSGAPVFDLKSQLVVGMISEITRPDEQQRLVNVAFATPSEILARVLPSLALQPRRVIETEMPFQVPNLPSVVIPRSALLDGVKRRLIAQSSAEKQSPIIVLYGMPGAGKGTLTSMLAHDPQVKERFAGGVLWTSLGPSPDLQSILRTWLSDVVPANMLSNVSPETVVGHLRAALRDKRMLMVVENAWAQAHIERLRVGGSGSVLLVTTRDQALAEELDPTPHKIDLFSEEEAWLLLSGFIGDRVTSSAAISELIRLTGRLPLALRFAGQHIRLRSGSPDWQLNNLVNQIQIRTADKVLDITGGPGSLQSIIAEGYDMELSSDEQEIIRLLGLLAELPLSTNVIATLLGQDVGTTGHEMDKLVDRSFLAYSQYHAGPTRYQLHPLLHDFAAQLTPEAEVSQRRTELATRIVQSLSKLDLRFEQPTVALECALALRLSEWPEQPCVQLLRDLRNVMSSRKILVDSAFFKVLNELSLSIRENSAVQAALGDLVAEALSWTWEKAGKAMGLRVKGLVESYQGQWHAAISTLRMAMAAYQDLNEPEAYGVMGANLIYDYLEKGSVEELRAADQLGQEMEAYLQPLAPLSALGRVYRHWALARQDLKDFSGALELLEKARLYIWEADDAWRKYSFLLDRATILLELKRCAEAKDDLTEAELYLGSNADGLDAAMLYEAWAEYYRRTRNLGQAWSFSHRAMQQLRVRESDSFELALAMLRQTKVLLSLGRFTEAIENLSLIEGDLESDLDRAEHARLLQIAISGGTLDEDYC